METKEITKTMTTEQVANRLIELCRMGKIDDAQDELFSENAVSMESNDMMGPKVVIGLEGIRGKSKLFQSMIEEFHGAVISDPIVSGNHFAITWSLDATMKGQKRSTMEEVCVYKVENGKIVLEQFFY
jgi:SnoaL-like domain